jgi:hypothetical protein
MTIDRLPAVAVVSEFQAWGASYSPDLGIRWDRIPAHEKYNAKSACRLNPPSASRGFLRGSTLPDRDKPRGGPTGRPLILAPTRDLRTSGKGKRVPSDEGKGRRYVQ